MNTGRLGLSVSFGGHNDDMVVNLKDSTVLSSAQPG